MKRIALLAVLLCLLTGCGKETSIEGTWEQEISLSVLGVGVEERTQVAAVQRFQFNPDGTGLMTVDAGENLPVSEATFQYVLEGDCLVLTWEEGGSESFSVARTEGSLRLNSSRVELDLKQAG